MCTSLVFEMQGDICQINGLCYVCNSVFADDPSKYCDPRLNQSSWSEISGTFAQVLPQAHGAKCLRI